MSERSDELVNELVAACIAFGREREPEGCAIRIETAQREIKAYIAELEAAQRWIPVSERLPEANTPVLTISKDNDVATPIDVALRKRIAGLEEERRWRIIADDEMPEHGDFVLAWDWDNEIIEVLEYKRTFGGEWFIDISDAAVYPTHWMPLPQPPEVQE